MKYVNLILFIFLLQGCLYFNDRGVSAHLYDNCHSYYDSDGNFVEECDENIVDYDEAKDGIIDLKNEITDDLNSITINSATNINKNVTNINSTEEIEEDIELSQSPCK